MAHYEKEITLEEYINEKVTLLHQLGFKFVMDSDFSKCTTEIAVDNVAHSIIKGKKCA